MINVLWIRKEYEMYVEMNRLKRQLVVRCLVMFLSEE